jgi:hypothetical protein
MESYYVAQAGLKLLGSGDLCPSLPSSWNHLPSWKLHLQARADSNKALENSKSKEKCHIQLMKSRGETSHLVCSQSISFAYTLGYNSWASFLFANINSQRFYCASGRVLQGKQALSKHPADCFHWYSQTNVVSWRHKRLYLPQLMLTHLSISSLQWLWNVIFHCKN